MRRTSLSAWLTAATLVAAAASCEGPGNTGRVPPDRALVRSVPWTNGALPVLDETGAPVLPADVVFPPIGLGKPDPGSRPADCGALQGIHTSSAWYQTFEPDIPDDPRRVGVAAGWVSFNDFTRNAFQVPGDVAWYTSLPDRHSADWGLPADHQGGPSCDGARNEWSLHLRGGLFRHWGAGVVSVFTDPSGCTEGTDICPPPLAAGAAVDSAGLPATAPDGTPYANSHGFIDASSYEGIAFWARRGPEGQSSITVAVTDNFTSERLASQNQKFCRRTKTCHSGCISGTPCSPDDPSFPNPIYRCFDPSKGALPFVAESSLLEVVYPRCGPSACTSDSSSPDPDFEGKVCRPYYFAAADVSGDACLGADEAPPNADEECQDSWARPVELSLDWKHYTVPFSELRQSGHGKVAPYLNTKAIDTLLLTFTVGWYDVYIDNLTFYRREK